MARNSPKSRKFKTRLRQQAFDRRHAQVQTLGRIIVSVVTVASTVLSFTVLGFSWQALGIAALGVVSVLSILLNIYLWKESRGEDELVKQIAFLTPSTGDQPFYSSMLTGLVRTASLALGQNYVIIPSMPTQNFETVSIWALFASLEDRQLGIDGLFFIPDDPDEHFEELVGFHEERGDIPLVLVDVYFDLDNCDERTRARLPSFVGGDEVAGGKMAAELMVSSVREAREDIPDAPRFAIVNGGSARWEMQRSKAFREEIRSVWPAAEFVETPSIPYSRTKAFEATLELMHGLAVDRQIDVLGIFACNDDMAIGARGAISRLHREEFQFTSPPQIVGYDGIPEIREYLGSGDHYIAGSVDVRIDEQARVAISLMQKLIRAGEPTTEVRLVVPNKLVRDVG